jgi:O-antigen/teichoic acid export membrane protein
VNFLKAATSTRLRSSGVMVAAAGFAVNGVGYFTPVLAARQLTPAQFSEVATALALLAIASVPGLGLQTALAVRWARDAAVPGALKASVATAATTGAALIAAGPIATALLHLPAATVPLVAASTVATILASRWLGELQGAQRFGALAVGMVLLALARYGGIVVGLLLGAGSVPVLALGAAGGWLTLPLFAVLALRRGAPAAPGAGPAAGLGRAVAAASGATMAMLAVSYADLILSRHFLPPAQAGAYAVGAVLTKGALWAPQVVTVLALPQMAAGSAAQGSPAVTTGRRVLAVSLGLVAACGLVLVLAAAVAGPLAVRLAGGPQYAFLSGYAAGFAVVGALYATVFLLVNAEIAAQARWPAAVLWIALAAMTTTAALIGVDSLGTMLALSVATATLAAVTMGLLALRREFPSR